MNSTTSVTNDVMEIAEKIVTRKINELKLVADQFYAKGDRERALRIDAVISELTLVRQGIQNNQGCW